MQLHHGQPRPAGQLLPAGRRRQPGRAEANSAPSPPRDLSVREDSESTPRKRRAAAGRAPARQSRLEGGRASAATDGERTQTVPAGRAEGMRVGGVTRRSLSEGRVRRICNPPAWADRPAEPRGRSRARPGGGGPSAPAAPRLWAGSGMARAGWAETAGVQAAPSATLLWGGVSVAW